MYDNNLCFFGGGGLVTNCVQLLRPHGLQPASLLCPWDFPGKNPGVGFHSLLRLLLHPGVKLVPPALQAVLHRWPPRVVLVTQSCPTLCDPMVCPQNSLHKNTGVGCHSLLQEIFPTQGSNRVSCIASRCYFFFYHLSYQGSPKIISLKA